MEALSMTDPLNKKLVHFDHITLNITSKQKSHGISITWYIFYIYILTLKLNQEHMQK